MIFILKKSVEINRQALENLGGLEAVCFDLDKKIVRIEGEADPIAIDKSFSIRIVKPFNFRVKINIKKNSK